MGFECGIALANFQDIQIGDTLEAFKNERVNPETLIQ
jgi:translation initiation factor IF-2